MSTSLAAISVRHSVDTVVSTLRGRHSVTTAPAIPRGDTPLRNVRVDDPLWEKAKEETRKRGTNPSEVMRDALARYVDHDHVWVGVDAILWAEVTDAAEAYGSDPWEVLRKALISYVKRHPVVESAE